MGFARLLVLAEERLLGRSLACLLDGRFEAHSIDSFERARRFLNADRVEAAIWLGDRIDEATVEGLAELKQTDPGLGLCLLARSAEPAALRPLLLANSCGLAIVFRTSELDVGELNAALRDVLAGRSSLEPAVLERLISEVGNGGDPLSSLTAAEHEVLELVSQGLRNREIARRVWKSEKAVEKQVSHVFEKLGLDQRATPHLDRRVSAARIFLTCRPPTVANGSAGGGSPGWSRASLPAPEPERS